jgi:putative hemolysin
VNAIPRLVAGRPEGRLCVELATTINDIRASQALRYRVFAGELGARLKGADQGVDEDHYDPYCQHLLVREAGSDAVIASTRLMLERNAGRAGGFYSESEFDMTALHRLGGRRLEIGRTCVDPAYRQGSAIAALWSGLAEFISEHRVERLFGCASVAAHDGGVQAQAIMHRVRREAMTPSDCRVIPRNPLPPLPDGAVNRVSAPLPPLLKSYFRLGALACGEPCHDPDFGCADILVMVDVNAIDSSYTRHFIDRVTRPR